MKDAVVRAQCALTRIDAKAADFSAFSFLSAPGSDYGLRVVAIAGSL
jgi:hypothetical protein